MADIQFTPAPWTIYEETAIDYRPCNIYGADGGSQIAVLMGGGRKRAISKSEERANARLISAAPDMLADHQENARLLSLVIHDLQGRVEVGKIAALSQCLDRSRAAIKKATAS